MSTTTVPEARSVPTARPSAWPVWAALVSSGCMIFGWNWDISWHRSIGRDTVWTLPHIAIYVALAVAFGYNAYLVLTHTFGARRGAPAIRLLGFSAPSATFITLWGILLQFAGIVFDDWWHKIYGLDIGVFSPAHAVIGFGIQVFYFGQFAYVALYRNNVLPDQERSTRWILIGIWSFFLGHAAITVDPSFGPMAVRSYAFVISSATLFPFLLVLMDEYMDWKWSSTAAAGLYMAGTVVLMQVFQFFPAEPKFGPVYHEVTNFIPPAFPLLLVVPALLVSLVVRGTRGRSMWMRTAAVSATFVITFNALNWAWSGFLASPAARNRFFGGGYPGSFFEETFRETPLMEPGAASVVAVLVAFAVSMLLAWFGFKTGGWLRGLRR